MTLILKSDTSKNGIIIKENLKKFEEATSTSGCDLEMSEITSSIPVSVTKSENNKSAMISTNVTAILGVSQDNVNCNKIAEDIRPDIEDVIDGFSVFSFLNVDDLVKFSITSEKIDSPNELEIGKSRKIAKSKKLNKFIKVNKETSLNEDSNDVYEFHENAESPLSSKTSSMKFSTLYSQKYLKHLKHKFQTESVLSASDENSSSTSSATELGGKLMGVESPRPTSNDDSNVVSTTTPDNGNIEHNDGVPSTVAGVSSLMEASLRLYKLEDEMSNNVSVPGVVTVMTEDLKVCNNPKEIVCKNEDDDDSPERIKSTKFSVDLLTKTGNKATFIDDANKCLANHNSPNCDRNLLRKSPEFDNSINSNTTLLNCIDNLHTSVTTSDLTDTVTNQMTSATVCAKSVIGGKHCCSSTAFRDGGANQTGVVYSHKDSKVITKHENPLTNDDENSGDSISNHNKSSSISSPMQSWMELHNKGLIHQQQLQQQQQNISVSTIMPTKTASSSSFNGLNSSTRTVHSVTNSKYQHDSAPFDWKNAYFDNTKLPPQSVHKYNQNYGVLSQDLVHNIRYQQEQQELMHALRLKHENSKIPKPLVHMGLDSMYKVDHPMYKNLDSRIQAPNVHNYFMSNPQLPIEFHTANVFKSRSEFKCRQNSSDTTQNKDSFSKTLPSASSANFKIPETLKRRGQWCDMHVRIAYFIYRSQKRLSLMKSQELNSQLSQLMYNHKLPPTGANPVPSAYQSGFLQHSTPFLDYRSSQLKSDPGNPVNYQSKSTSAFLTTPSRSLNPYHNAVVPPNVDADYLPIGGNPYEDLHASPEQKWLRLLSNYMTGHQQSSADRPSPELMNQIYSWYQQFAQNTNTNNGPHYGSSVPLQSSNIDHNMAYLRKYMEHLSSYVGSMKSDPCGYTSDRDIQLYLQKQQQQYQKAALFSKYQTGPLPKPTSVEHINSMLMSSSNPFYGSTKNLTPSYPDCFQSLVNQKYRLTQDQIHLMRQDAMLSHQSRNGFSKLTDQSHPKRRKLNSESQKIDVPSSRSVAKEDSNGDYGHVTSLNTNGTDSNDAHLDPGPAKSKEDMTFHMQTMIPDSKP